MNQPHARVTALQYRNIAIKPGAHPTMPVLRVHLRTHEDTHEFHDLPNGDWNLANVALQFMALYGWQPTDLDGTFHDAHDDQVLVPIAPTGDDMSGEWGLAQNAMQGAQEALKDAEWFGTDDDEESPDDRPEPPRGGPGPDPGTGNRAGVDHETDEAEETGVTVEKAPADSNAGMTVKVE